MGLADKGRAANYVLKCESIDPVCVLGKVVSEGVEQPIHTDGGI